ncbi:hypothetical protein BJ912DRAFT_928503 [Pholiota molesta]|nr:hypothetical protein BJ912DRAFT_928503 [Pholiota molesta]
MTMNSTSTERVLIISSPILNGPWDHITMSTSNGRLLRGTVPGPRASSLLTLFDFAINDGADTQRNLLSIRVALRVAVAVASLHEMARGVVLLFIAGATPLRIIRIVQMPRGVLDIAGAPLLRNIRVDDLPLKTAIIGDAWALLLTVPQFRCLEVSSSSLVRPYSEMFESLDAHRFPDDLPLKTAITGDAWELKLFRMPRGVLVIADAPSFPPLHRQCAVTANFSNRSSRGILAAAANYKNPGELQRRSVGPLSQFAQAQAPPPRCTGRRSNPMSRRPCQVSDSDKDD